MTAYPCIVHPFVLQSRLWFAVGTVSKSCSVSRSKMLAKFHRLTELGEQAAFRMLQTNPDDFQWWLFAANLGRHTEHVIGNGLVAGALVDRSDARKATL